MQNLDRRTWLLGAAAASGLPLVLPLKALAETAVTPPRPTIEAFMRSPQADFVTMSPDGLRIAYIATRGDESVLTFFTIGAPKPSRASLNLGKIRDLLWGDNDHVMVISSQVAGASFTSGNRYELHLATWINLTTLKPSNLFAHSGDFDNAVSGPFQRIKTGDTYRITASNYDGASGHNRYLFAFSPDKDYGLELITGPFEIEAFVITPTGQPVAYAYSDNDFWQVCYNFGTPGHSRYQVIYKAPNTPNAPDLVGLGRDGASLVLCLYDGDGNGTLHELSSEGVVGPALFPNAGAEEITPLFHPTTWRLDGYSTYGDKIRYTYSDPTLKAVCEALPAVIGDDRRTRIVEFADDPRRMLVYSEGSDDAGSYAVVDFRTGDLIVVADRYPDLPGEWITQKQAITYKAGDGLDIHAYLTLPPSANGQAAKATPKALIVLPHGGPQSRDFADYDAQVQALASRGYAVLQPNFRGSDGYGPAFVNAGHGEWGRKMQSDLSDGVKWLAGKGIIDPKRVAIVGASYGGYAALAGATLDQGIYRCAVSVAGPSDLDQMIEYTRAHTGRLEGGAVKYWKRFLGDAGGWDDVSPAKQAARAYCPVLLIHGTDDTVVPIDQSWRMQSALKAAGKSVQLISFKGQDHWETISSARVDMMEAIVAFVETHNPA